MSLPTPRLPLQLPLLIALGLLVAPATASAHERDFTLSRDWRQPLKGELELELWNAWETREDAFEGILKLDHGITEHFALEPEFEYVKADGDHLELKRAELERLEARTRVLTWRSSPRWERLSCNCPRPSTTRRIETGR